MIGYFQFGGTSDGDGTSVISGNSIVGEKETITEGDTSKYESKMILFNGLYFRGMWAVPFQVRETYSTFIFNVNLNGHLCFRSNCVLAVRMYFIRPKVKSTL